MEDKETKRNTRQKIFEAAAGLFANKGYSGVSMREIASKAGIKESSIYNHFHSKEDILDSLLNYFSENMANYRPSIEEVNKLLDFMTPEEVFKQIIISFGRNLNGILDHVARLVFTEQFRNEKAKELMLEKMIAEPSRYIEDILKIMAGKKLIRDINAGLFAAEYNYALLAITFEYAHAVNSGEATGPIIAKMFRHVAFFCEYLKTEYVNI